MSINAITSTATGLSVGSRFRRCISAHAAALMRTDRPVAVDVIAFMNIPKSWTKKKKLEAEYGAISAVGKPDLDNIAKAALDGIAGDTGVIFDDTQVVSLKCKKTFCHPDRGPVLYIAVSWTDET